MNRLTYINHKKGGIFDCEKELPAFAKLGQLEDIEEELGIELLVILNKVLKQGAWFMLPEWDGSKNKPSFVRSPTLGYSNQWYLEYDYFIFHLADYGKTWALSEEELKKNNKTRGIWKYNF